MRNLLYVATALALAGIQPAKAIDFSQVLFDFRGDPIVDETRPGPRDAATGKLSVPRFCFRAEFMAKPSECDVLTLGIAAANAVLRGRDPDNAEPSIDDIKRRKALADRVAKGGKIDDLSPEDVTLIRKMAKTYYNPIVSSQIITAMEGK